MLGIFAVIAGGVELYYQDALEVVIVYLASYVSVVCCLVFKKFLSYRVRAISFLTSLYLLAFFVLARVGLGGTGVHILITFSLLSTLFLGVRTGLKAVALGFFSIVSIGICMSLNLIPVDIATMPNSTQFVAWAVVAIVFIVIGMVMVVGPGILQLSLIKDVAKAKRSENINKTLFAIANAVNVTIDLKDLYKHIHNLLGNTIDRKQSYEELEKEKKTLLMTLESNPHGIALTDKNDKYLYVNPCFTKITGYTLEDIPSKEKWFEKAYPDVDYRNKIKEAWSKDSINKSAGGDRDFKIQSKDGLTKNIEFRNVFLKDITISVLTDVTNRKEAEKAMLELEKKLALSQKMESIGLLAGFHSDVKVELSLDKEL